MSFRRNLPRGKGNRPRLLTNNDLKGARSNGKILAPNEELKNIRAAEAEQCSFGDRFWGKDQENMDMLLNQKSMEKEFQMSSNMEFYYKEIAQQKTWEDDYMMELQQDAFNNAIEEQKKRNKYMKKLFKSESSELVSNYNWSTGSIIPPVKRGPSGLDNTNMRDITLDIINPDFIGNQTLFHLEGLQQARAVSVDSISSPSSVDPMKSYNLGPLMRGRASTPGIAQDKMMSMVTEGSQVGTQSQSRSLLHMFSPDQDLKSLIFGTKEKPHITEEMKRASQSFEGHPHFKWDQESILREVFESLDTEQQGFLYPEHLSKLASSSLLQYLLSFTVFGAWVKRKQWSEFQKALYADKNGASSNESLNMSTRIDLNTWYTVALSLAREVGKPLKQIRTEEEHLELLTHDNNFHSLDGNTLEYAALTRRQHDRPERDAYIAKTLDVGDVVWALHSNGHKWFPAVVENVNPHDLTYDIKYTLSQAQLGACRKKCMGAEILQGKRINRPKDLNHRVFPSHYLHVDKAAAIDAVLAQDSSREIHEALNSILSYNQH